ncbi:MAG TPA: gephyrin-like molybdotransferase Glp [Jatrophihabitans sp.]|nr:gephyrin-like molybdotransferase Glp [Jatrophihabitans sp.]
MIELAEAREQLLAACPRLDPIQLASADAIDCVLAEDVVSAVAVPPFDNTSLDGYAVRSADLAGASEAHPARVTVLGMVPAGSAAASPVGPGQAWKVMTGAPLPAGADAVVMVENSSATKAHPCSAAGDSVELYAAPAPGTGIRLAGSDTARGELVFPRGTVLRPAHLGVLASVGAHTVTVQPRPRVGVLVTGDELVTEARELAPGEIYESNRAMLMALLRKLNCDPVDLGIAPDQVSGLRTRLGRAIAECDVIVSSGGVSMGDADPIKAVLEELGRLNWLQLAIRPAKPFAYGLLDGPTMLLGLPGNPVSALVSFTLLVAPVLRQLLGYHNVEPEFIPAIAEADFGAQPDDGRTGYLRATAHFGPDGRLRVQPLLKQGSHQLSAAARANALVRVPPGLSPAAGAEVATLLLH